MKKFFLSCGMVAVLCGVISCGKSHSATTTPEDAAMADSAAVLFGQVIGGQVAQNIKQQDPNLKDDSFFRGINTAVMADTADQSYLQGLSMGLRFAQQFQYISKELGMDIDRNMFMTEFKKAFQADSFPNLMADQAQLNALMERVQARAEERKNEELNNAPEAVANREAGEKFIAELKAKDPAVKTTASGLSYKVITEGAGDSITDKDQVSVIYKGSLPDGTVFDDSKGEARRFSPRSVVPGFGEGLKMMKKGAKYMLYIPGDLAYGVKGQPYAKIGPNQTLVFEVEIADVNASNTPASKK